MLNVCMNCMEELKDGVCPNCGENVETNQPKPFISTKTLIGQRYIIGKGLKKDAEGLSYIGYDFIKRQKVYVREFFPQEFCVRDEKGCLKPSGAVNAEVNIKILYDDFLKYFRCIARLRQLPALAAVYDILEQNSSIYVIIEWIEGMFLDEYLSQKGGALQWKEARVLFMPLLSSLSKMASAKIYHLGITPGNMIVTKENKIKLTGFTTKNSKTTGSLLTSELNEGCSALEQYIANAEISECTDVYGYAASLFFTLIGEYVPCALERKKKDKLLVPSNILKELPENVVAALANALRVYPNSRTLSFETLRIELSNSPVLKVKDIYNNQNKFTCKIPANKSYPDDKRWGIISFVTALLLLITCFGIYWFWIKEKNSSLDNTLEESLNSPVLLSNEVPEETEASKVETPQLVGKTVNAAQNGSTSENPYSVVVLSEEFHDSIEEGCIISQTPAYGEEMYIGSTIAVNVSKGPEKRALPSIIGKSLAEASLILTEAKFKPSQVGESSSKFPSGTVIRYQSYQAGDLVSYGSEIVIVVSKG